MNTQAPTPRPLRSRSLPLATVLLATVSGVGCFDQISFPNESDGRLLVTNDESALEGRMTYPDDEVPIMQPPTLAPDGTLAPPQRAPSRIDLTLVAEVLPPSIGGVTVQANSVWATRDDRAIVSYNVQGNARAGALDYFEKLDDGRPRLKSSVQFADADASAVFVDGRYAYVATATDDVIFPAPAVLERIRVTGSKFRIDSRNARIPMTSFAGTGAMSTGDEIYATSGDGGGVFAYDEGDMSLLGEFALDDARWVAWDEDNDRIAVLQGTPGRISVFREGSFRGGSMTLLNTFPFPGADVPESKSTVEVVGGKAFIAAGAEGVQIMCLDNGEIVGSIPRPDPASLGLDPSVVVTNAVTVDDDLIFISNGEAGVYVAAGEDEFDDSDCDEPLDITMIGRLQFDDLQSVNHVVYRDDRLFIAAGLGGIKVVDVDDDD